VKPLFIVFVTFGLTLATATADAVTTSEPHHLQPNAPRSVTVTEAETPPVIRAGLLQSTLILLPAEEKIATVFGGDTVDWVFDGGHVASRFISIKPKLANTSTDIHIVTLTLPGTTRRARSLDFSRFGMTTSSLTCAVISRRLRRCMS
jgi:hypothetical protein